MGQLANILRSQLRELAQSDARILREIDQILKESRAIDDKIKRLK